MSIVDWANRGVIMSQRGFTLVSVLISVGIASLVALAIASAIAAGVAGQSHINRVEQVRGSTETIASIIGDADYCSQRLAGTVVNSSNFGNTTPAIGEVTLMGVDSAGNYTSVIFGPGVNVSPDLTIGSIALMIGQAFTPVKYTGAIVVTYSSPNGLIKAFRREIPLVVQLRTNATTGNLEIDRCGFHLVDSPSSGGGGVPGWGNVVGVTSAKYKGDLDGLVGAAAKCSAEFPGTRMCTEDEILKVSSPLPGGDDAWLSPTLLLGVSNDCHQWQSSYGGVIGRVLRQEDMNFRLGHCEFNRPILCCK